MITLDGWEHVEFILPNISEEDNTKTGIGEAFYGQFPALRTGEFTTRYSPTLSSPTAEGEQTPNPTLGFTVNNIGLKFHDHSIEAIVS